jgi:hypothetical protein
MQQFLVVSFSFLVGSLMRDEVTVAQLANALFAFTWPRSSLFGLSVDAIIARHYLDIYGGVRSKSDRRRLRKIVRAIKQTMLAAEQSTPPRVVWSTRDADELSYEKLNALLASNGLPTMSIESPDNDAWKRHYCYPGVNDRVYAGGIPVHVIPNDPRRRREVA